MSVRGSKVPRSLNSSVVPSASPAASPRRQPRKRSLVSISLVTQSPHRANPVTAVGGLSDSSREGTDYSYSAENLRHDHKSEREASWHLGPIPLEDAPSLRDIEIADHCVAC